MPLTVKAPTPSVKLVAPEGEPPADLPPLWRTVERVAACFGSPRDRRHVRAYLYTVLREPEALRHFDIRTEKGPLRWKVKQGRRVVAEARAREPDLFRRLLGTLA